MATFDYVQIAVYFAALFLLTPVLGSYMAKVFSGERHVLSWILSPLECLFYRLSFIDKSEEMTWKRYAFSLAAFSAFGLATVIFLQVYQIYLPLNPQEFANVPWCLALNTAISFVTNTNWQAYAGESSLSYFVQAVGLGVQNFVSAATGIAVVLALIRGFVRKENGFVGNFWVDITRATIYVLLPLSLFLAVVLLSQGVVQDIGPYVKATTIEGATQLLPMGPAASQIAIKQLGTNGGGFFGANSAHPFENPTALSNFLQMLAILLLPSALVYTFGVMTNARRHAAAIYCVMAGMLFVAVGFGVYEAHMPNPSIVTSQNFEGIETRFGITNSALWAITTTAASNGSVNAMHDSLAPITGGLALMQMLVGEVIFGGVGAGLYGMLLFILLTVFLAGLMVGRTPEYFGKKIEAKEIQLTLIAILSPCAVVLIGSSVTILYPEALLSLGNKGPHGLSEILYAWGSTANNNGSAFGGLNANTNFFNLSLAASMLVGRFFVIFPVLAIAGSLATKKTVPLSPATFATDSVLFAVLLFCVILIVGALTFMPALALGPVVEHFLMESGKNF